MISLCSLCALWLIHPYENLCILENGWLEKQRMIYRALADFVLLFHMAFVLFAALGGVLVFKWRRVAWFHIPAALWAALIELVGWVCPLTPLENWLRHKGGEAGYQTGFLERYLLPLIYPAPFSRSLHVILGLLVMGVNLAIYWWIWRRANQSRQHRFCDGLETHRLR